MLGYRGWGGCMFRFRFRGWLRLKIFIGLFILVLRLDFGEDDEMGKCRSFVFGDVILEV